MIVGDGNLYEKYAEVDKNAIDSSPSREYLKDVAPFSDTQYRIQVSVSGPFVFCVIASCTPRVVSRTLLFCNTTWSTLRRTFSVRENEANRGPIVMAMLFHEERTTLVTTPQHPLAQPAEGPSRVPLASKPGRLESVDLLRGLVMVIMALDHARHYFTIVRFSPVNLDETTVAHFFTRWLTHVCAPAFVFLAGTGAFLFRTRGKTKGELAWFLFSRGIWLVFLELTVMRMGWQFSFDYSYAVGQTIWAIGWSMVVLSILVFLPVSIMTVFGIVMIAVHNAFDGIRPKMLGDYSWLWKILHSGGRIQVFDNYTLSAMYPLIPWIGVMAAGFGFGLIMKLEEHRRRKILWLLGGGVTAMFILLRWLNIYGDPHQWTIHESLAFTVMDFLNCDKYPPSLLFLMMTLGPAIASLALFERMGGRFARFFIVFGRVPLFFYVLHIFLIHALAVLAAYATLGGPASLVGGVKPVELPEGYGFGLPVVYLVWMGISLALYPACRWYADVKRRNKSALFSYL